ncbi:hypothetical protein GH5_00862 [Leishmania sp. Ghana 2012 LV757]|uniref:hypothetical protein n=1 Tax=Leishmania sp. Ghana 2012 LV757 TaxID=2803181 RepID=UPI001B65532C|nr:hypothetical protein GH5_00862 [Leishmania sp. Ghana 2012 LV757]
MNTSVNVAAWSVGQASSASSSDSLLSICLNRYLQWLSQLHGTIDAVSDDAYTLDRLLRQGVLPLRQRTAVAPTAAETRLRAAVCALLIGDAAVQSASSKAATRSGHTTAIFSSATSSPPIVHTETPPCPCLAYFEQQQREAESRLFSLNRRSSKDEDDCKEIDAGNAATISSASGNDDKGNSGASPLSGTVSHFQTRPKDALRGVDSAGSSDGLAGALLAHTTMLGCTEGSFSSHGDAAAFVRKISADSRLSDAPSQTAHLLPVAVSTPSFAASAEFACDAPQAKSGGGAQRRQHGSRECSDSSAPLPFRALPVPVGADTQADRALHPMLAHIRPEDVRRCALCSAQVLVESAWHTLYQMNLLTLLSAAPSMAAPLPLPPPGVLRMHPAEALLLLYQCAQRCFVAGITMATPVGLPSPPMKNGLSSPQGDASAQPPSALDVLRGGHGGEAAATTCLAEISRHATEERLLAGLAGGLLCVVEGVTGTAAPQLWPRSTTAVPAKRTMANIMGDLMGLRFALFHIIFLILTTENGGLAALAKLPSACDELLACVQRLASWPNKTCGLAESSRHSFSLHQRSQDGTRLSEGDGQEMASSKKAADAAVAEKLLSFTPFDTDPLNAVHEALIRAFDMLDVTHVTAGSVGDSIGEEALTIVMDDIRGFCCVAALVGTFAGLVRTREMSASADAGSLLPASDPASPFPTSLMSSSSLSRDHHCLLDYHVYPCLQRLQSSTRGDCSAQARHLIALWWLLRAETVRHWAWAATNRPSQMQSRSALEKAECDSSAKGAALHVLGVTITLHEDPQHEAQQLQGQQRQHWPQWLKDASRAAVRASDAVNEFLGLTLISAWSSTSSRLSMPSQSSVTDAASMTAPLRWRLSASSTLSLSSQAPVAFLPLPWIRLWLLLCPPLFRISPADVFAIRERVQQQPQSPKEGAPQRLGAPTIAGGGVAPGGTKKAAAGATNKKAEAPQASSKYTRQVGNCAQTKAPQRTAGAPPSSVAAGTLIGSRGYGGNCTTGTAAPSHDQGKEARLQRRLQLSKEPVCFWLRWCLLFMPSPLVQEQRVDSSVSSNPSSTLLLSALESVARGLCCPRAACFQGPQRSAAPPTVLVCLLQHAFPLYTPANLMTTLTAQAQLFLACGADQHRVAAAEAQAAMASLSTRATLGGADFAPYSFTVAVAALRKAVAHSKQLAPSASLGKDCNGSVLNAATVAAAAESTQHKGTRRPPLVAGHVLSRRVAVTSTKSSAAGTATGEGDCCKVEKVVEFSAAEGSQSRVTDSASARSAQMPVA